MLLLAASLIAVADTPSTDRALLQAFEAPCTQVADFGRTRTAALADGWAAISEEADPRVAKLSAVGREAAAEADAAGTMSGAVYKRTLGGREVFLIVSRYEDASGYWGNGCRVYDFEAAAPLALETVRTWIGKAPTHSEQLSGATRHLWEPWAEGRTFEASYVPAGGEMDKRFGLRGVVLVSQAIGGF